MRSLIFAGRTTKEIVRDPLNLSFGLALPVILLVLMSIIQKNVPVQIFEITKLAPGIAVFSLSFLTLFAGTTIAKDKNSAFLLRLYTTPMRAIDFILGYSLPLIPIGIGQCLICYIVAFMFGLPFSINVLYALFTIVPISLFFISLGVLLGSVLNIKAVGGICGALVTNLTALLSGIWIDLSLLGNGLKTFALCLPFANAVELEKGVLNATYEGTLLNFIWIIAYSLITTIIAIVLFVRQMKKN